MQVCGANVSQILEATARLGAVDIGEAKAVGANEAKRLMSAKQRRLAGVLRTASSNTKSEGPEPALAQQAREIVRQPSERHTD